MRRLKLKSLRMIKKERRNRPTTEEKKFPKKFHPQLHQDIHIKRVISAWCTDILIHNYRWNFFNMNNHLVFCIHFIISYSEDQILWDQIIGLLLVTFVLPIISLLQSISFYSFSNNTNFSLKLNRIEGKMFIASEAGFSWELIVAYYFIFFSEELKLMILTSLSHANINNHVSRYAMHKWLKWSEISYQPCIRKNSSFLHLFRKYFFSFYVRLLVGFYMVHLLLSWTHSKPDQ